MDLTEATKKEIDVILGKCGWRQTKQRVVLLKSIFDGKDKHFSINQMNETLKDNRSYFSLTTLYENLNTLVEKGYLKQIVVDKQSFYDTNTTNHIHVYHQEENKIYDYDDCTELHKDLPIPACLALLEEYSLVINLKKKN